MKTFTFILNENGEPVAEPDFFKWAKWRGSAHRRVAVERVNGYTTVSTVFLGMDSNSGGGAPILWETMVFGGPLNEHRSQCSGSREQAWAMHQQMVERVRNLPTIQPGGPPESAP